MSARIDYKALFSKTLYEEMVLAFGVKGVEVITEDELDELVAECTHLVYEQSIGEFRKVTGQSLFAPRTLWGGRRMIPIPRTGGRT